MKYSLIIPFLLTQLATYGQQTTCFLSNKSIFKNGILTYEQKNVYNEKWQLIKKEERFLDPAKLNYTSTEQYIFDTNGNVIETTSTVNGKFNKSVFRKFDGKTNLLEEAIVTAGDSKKKITKTANFNELKLINEDGSFSKIVSENDEEGNLTKKTVFGLDGKATNIIVYSYNNNGELTEKSEVEMFRNKTTATFFIRNENGAIQEEVSTVNGEPVRRIVNSLNTDGNVSQKKVYNSLNQLDYTMTYTYDTNKNVTSESYFYNEELITKAEKTYDTNGNLTLQRNFERGKLISTINWEYTCP